MLATTWRERVEWSTLVAVIFAVGLFAQTRSVVAEDEADEQELTVVAEVQVGAGDAKKVEKKSEKKVIVTLRGVGGQDIDVDVESDPATKVIERIIRLSGDQDGEAEGLLQMAAQPPSHYIGIHGGKVDPVLRTHLKLQEGQGVLVLMVVDDSPADQAGIEEHDILLAANGKKLGKLTDLVEIIRDTKDSELTLELIHEGEETSLAVKPEKRPKDFTAPLTGWTPSITGKLHVIDPDRAKEMQVWVEKLRESEGKGGLPGALRLRALGPGLTLRALHSGPEKIPSGIFLNITKEDDEPAKIKVKQDGKTWEFRADDEEAIAELPDGTRTFIESMLGGHGMGVFGAEAVELDLPEAELHAEELHFTPPHDLMERMEKMEQRLKELRDELRELHEEDHD